MNWEWRIDMIYDREWRCHTYRYIIRKDKVTIFSKNYFKYDESRIELIMNKLKKESV